MRALKLFIFLLLFSCGSKTVVPKEVLPVDKMTAVLWDVMLADELVNGQYAIDATGKKLDTSVILYRQIAQSHNITQQSFKKSLQFYQGRPDLLQIILDSLQRKANVPPVAQTPDSLLLREVR